MSAALLGIALSFAIAIALGLAARRGRTMNLEQWSVGGRGFGALFVFLLMAGEIFTTFSFLGGSGWAYGRGGPAFYILAYGTVAYVLSYFLLPLVLRHATRARFHSQADFFAGRYRSPALGLLVALVGVAAMVPYLVLQLKGLGILVSELSYGGIGVPQAVLLGAAALVLYVTVSGVHGSAWTAVVKDILILAVAVGLGIYFPLHLHGGFRAMFASIEAARPGFLALPAQGLSPSWFISTVLLSACGFYMWPHTFGSVYTARSEDVFRKNAVAMPLYQLVLLFVFFTGFAALSRIPGLTGSDADLALVRLCKASFAPWLVGVVGAAGVLTALVPGSMILLACATILAKNVFARATPRADERRIGLVARALVPVVAALAVAITLAGGTALVPLLLAGYNVVTQLFPALLLALPERTRATPQGAIAGILAGEAMVALLTLTEVSLPRLLPSWPRALTDINVGAAALLVNAAMVLAVSAVTRRRD